MYLIKNNTKIYYEACGSGEPLLLIHGVITDSTLYRETSRILSDYYRVIRYDRRGNSRSKTVNTPYEFDLKEQADDIRDLLDELGIQETYIAGASAGAVIGQYFLSEYPDRVRHLIMYEPAMLGHMLKTDEEFREWSAVTESLVNRGKLSSALLRFAAHLGPADSRSPARSEEDSIMELGNLEYAMRCEIPGLKNYNPDPESICRYADRITIAVGEKSGDSVYVREAQRLSEMTGRKVLYYPGGHNLPYDLPEEFAVCVLGTFKLNQ